ncbi:MAG: thioredoxin domain-containing protein [Planctomycetota bacterium]|nr:thioredoxin domain-containing protein [Planctomycetota bacterium]
MRSILQALLRYVNWIVLALVIFVVYRAVSGPSSVTNHPKISDEQFESTLKNDSVPVIVKFGATWCPPCRTTDKALAEFEKSTPGKAEIMIVDIDLNRELASRFSVRSIPHTFLFFRGKMIDEQVGGMDADEINSWLDKKLINISANN